MGLKIYVQVIFALFAIYSLYLIRRERLNYKDKKREVEQLEKEEERKRREVAEQEEVIQRLEKTSIKMREGIRSIQVERELIEKEKQKTSEELQDLTAQVLRANDTINELVKNERQVAEERVHAEIALLRTLKLGEFKKEKEELEGKLWDDYWKLSDELKPLKKEIEDYRAKRESIIDALKRERELAEQEDYYRVLLSEEAISDIGYIKSILDKLSNKKMISELIFKSYIQEPAKEMINRVVGLQKTRGIYRITDIKTQECYIGQGVDVGARLIQHIKGSLGIQSIADQRVHRAMAERGLENWTFELLEECERSELTEREKFYISHYKSNEFGFNKRLG